MKLLECLKRDWKCFKLDLKNFCLGVFKKENASMIFKAVMFILCTYFLLGRVYYCIKKYGSNPEHTEVSYAPSKNNPFPSFTLCPYENSSYNFDGLGVKNIQVRTYIPTNNQYQFDQNNWSELKWKRAVIGLKKGCFSFSIPIDVVREGIKVVLIKSKAIKTLYLHKEGTLTAPVPRSILSSKFARMFKISVKHENVELLTYGGKQCLDDANYDFDICKQEYIHKVLYTLLF